MKAKSTKKSQATSVLKSEKRMVKNAKKNAATEVARNITNGLGSALGLGFNEGLQGVTPFGTLDSVQLSQVNTLFKNNRWYLVSNFRQLLSEIYVEIGLVQTVVDVPVDDALRGGVEIKSLQLDEDQIRELQVAIDRDDDINTVGQAGKWNRLFGGAGILIMSDQDPATPLDLSLINVETPLEMRAVDMWELFWDIQNTTGYQPTQQEYVSEFYSYYGTKVHKSRVMALKGLIAPSFIRPRLRGWGFSVVEALVRSINQYLKATDLSFEVLDEFKLDIFKIKNLTNTLLSSTGEETVRRRVAMANMQKNYQNALTMDSEDDYVQKQLSFAGLAETMEGIRIQVASDMRMPLTKLFGTGAQGFNSGEDDIEVYNSMVESTIRSKLKYPLLKIIEIKCQQLFGMIPDDLSISFKPLRVLSSEQEQNCKTQIFQRALQSRQAGQITQSQFLDICNKANLLEIQIDPEEAELAADELADEQDLDKPDSASEEKSELDAKDAKEAKASGANEPDKRSVELPEKPTKDTKEVKNSSIDFQVAAYEADGGDGWIDHRRIPLFEPEDKAQWLKAEMASHEAFGKLNKAFSIWLYKKLGGKSNE